MKIIAAILGCVALSGCTTRSEESTKGPIVNSGVTENMINNQGNNSGYVPWWVEEKVPNSAGVIVK